MTDYVSQIIITFQIEAEIGLFAVQLFMKGNAIEQRHGRDGAAVDFVNAGERLG
jgi:hypothetical protein